MENKSHTPSVGMEVSTDIMENSIVEVPQRTTIYYVYPISRHISKEIKSTYQRDTYTPTAFAVLLTIAKIWNHIGFHQQMNK